MYVKRTQSSRVCFNFSSSVWDDRRPQLDPALWKTFASAHCSVKCRYNMCPSFVIQPSYEMEDLQLLNSNSLSSTPALLLGNCLCWAFHISESNRTPRTCLSVTVSLNMWSPDSPMFLHVRISCMFVFVSFRVTGVTCPDRSNSGRKGLLQQTVPGSNPSQQEVRAAGQ